MYAARAMRKGLLTPLLALVILGGTAPVANGAVSWDVPSYSFPSTDVGISSAPRTFTLTATCSDPMMATCGTLVQNYMGVEAPGADFNIDSTDCMGTLLTPLAASTDDCTVTVAFKPSAAGARSGVLRTGTGVQVVLNGTGVDPAAAGAGSGSGKKKCKKKKKGKSSASSAKKRKCKKKKK
jgi:hypothetical protein